MTNTTPCAVIACNITVNAPTANAGANPAPNHSSTNAQAGRRQCQKQKSIPTTNKIAVIGLGRFGMRLARRLSELGHEVIALDRDMALVEEIKDVASVAVQLDVTDEKALVAQGVHKVATAVVAIGESFEMAQLCTVILKKIGVKRVISRAQNDIRAKILTLVGADGVIMPETESASQWALRLHRPNLVDYLPLMPGFSVMEIPVPKDFIGKRIKETELRSRYHLNLLAIKKSGNKQNPFPEAGAILDAGDELIVYGQEENLTLLPT